MNRIRQRRRDDLGSASEQEEEGQRIRDLLFHKNPHRALPKPSEEVRRRAKTNLSQGTQSEAKGRLDCTSRESEAIKPSRREEYAGGWDLLQEIQLRDRGEVLREA